ncbi:MAG: L-serine ammonia-lyase, iron-sulfur-dependent, subunit alpha [Defluviitaleaceae bacterium]|nr:L-serine ammonia-lyase, iron-sulfur-dependent, subunit alpha [Defluviitaleaceae bacterium]
MITFTSVQAIIELAEQEKTTISAVTLRQSAEDVERSELDILAQMQTSLTVMKQAITEGCAPDVSSVSGLVSDWAYKVKNRVANGNSLCGGFVGEVIYNALAVMQVNTCMGRIVAAPTAGSCGILPACLIALQNHHGISDEQIINGLLTASAIGMVIANNATLSGAEGGCQAECGSAAAMTAAAITEIMGGNPTMCGVAAAQALKSIMGLVCDPVAGLVEEPCVIRNATSATIALTSAELALADVPTIIPIDEVIKAMATVGKQMPASLRETADGGIAQTPTGRKIMRGLYTK